MPTAGAGGPRRRATIMHIFVSTRRTEVALVSRSLVCVSLNITKGKLSRPLHTRNPTPVANTRPCRRVTATRAQRAWDTARVPDQVVTSVFAPGIELRYYCITHLTSYFLFEHVLCRGLYCHDRTMFNQFICNRLFYFALILISSNAMIVLPRVVTPGNHRTVTSYKYRGGS